MSKLNFLTLFFISASLMAQVGIGTDNPDPNMALDVAGDIIIRDLPEIPDTQKGLRPLFINTDGTLAASQTAGRLAIYESFAEAPLAGTSTALAWDINDADNNTGINTAPVVLQNFTFTSTLNAKVMRVGLALPTISSVYSINNNLFNNLYYDLKIEILEGTTLITSKIIRERLRAEDEIPLNSGEFRFFYFPFEKPAGNYTIRLTSLNRERGPNWFVDGITVRTLTMLVQKRAIFIELFSDL